MFHSFDTSKYNSDRVFVLMQGTRKSFARSIETYKGSGYYRSRLSQHLSLLSYGCYIFVKIFDFDKKTLMLESDESSRSRQGDGWAWSALDELGNTVVLRSQEQRDQPGRFSNRYKNKISAGNV